MKLIKKYLFGNQLENSPYIFKTKDLILLELFNKDYYNLDEFDYNTLGIQMLPLSEALKYADPDVDYKNLDRKLMQNMSPNTKVPVLNGRLFSRGVWDEMRGKQNHYTFPSEEIVDETMDRKALRLKLHRQLHNSNNTQDLALTLMAAGAAPFIPELVAASSPVYTAVAPALKTAGEIATVAYGANEGALAINSASKGNYGDAAAHAALAATTAAGPWVSMLSKYPRLAAIIGTAGIDAAAYARVIDEDYKEIENNINNHIKNTQYIPTDDDVELIKKYLTALNFQIDLREEQLTDDSVYLSYDITSKDEEPNTESIYSVLAPEIAGGTYIFSRSLAPRLYEKITRGKQMINWEKVPKWFNKPYIRSGKIIPDLLAGAGYAYWRGKDVAKRLGWKKEDEDKLTEEQRVAASNAIRLLKRRYPDLSLKGILPDLQMNVKFLPNKDTVDYIPGLEIIDEYVNQPKLNLQLLMDSTTAADAPEEY